MGSQDTPVPDQKSEIIDEQTSEIIDKTAQDTPADQITEIIDKETEIKTVQEPTKEVCNVKYTGVCEFNRAKCTECGDSCTRDPKCNDTIEKTKRTRAADWNLA